MTSALLSLSSLLQCADDVALVVYVVYVVVYVVRRPFSSKSPSKKMGAGKSTLPMIGLDPNIITREEDTSGVLFSSKMTLMDDDDDDAKETTIVVDRGRHKIASSSPATKGMATKTQLAEVCVVAQQTFVGVVLGARRCASKRGRRRL